MLTQLTIFLYIVIFLYGIVIGSFLNVLIFRIPKKENIVQSSHCMNCGHKLGWRDMVPVFSYIILRGRCRQCGARISIQYPLIEALNGVLYVVVFMAGGFTFSSVLGFSASKNALELITRRIIKELEGDENKNLEKYATTGSPEYEKMVSIIAERFGLTSLKFNTLETLIEGLCCLSLFRSRSPGGGQGVCFFGCQS